MRALITKTLFVLSILPLAQALAFDVGGLSYTITSGTTAEVTGRAVDNTATDIAIPANVVDSGTTYSVTSVGDSAFFINALTSVTIPDSVTIIGPYAFQGNALTSVTIPDSVTINGTQAFFSNALTSVTIPDSVKTIGDSAFYNNALTSVIIPNSVTTIGEGAFSNNALTSVIIGNSVKTIGDSAFKSNALTSVIIPNSVTTIGEYAFWQNALTSVTIPDSVTIIGRYAFNTNALTRVIIGNSVTSIGDSAFYINALTSVTIPDSVTSIGSGAFAFNSLTSAAFLGNFGTFNLNMFLRNPNLMTITYAQGAKGWPQTFTSETGSITATAASTDLSAQALAFDVGGLSYDVIKTEDGTPPFPAPLWVPPGAWVEVTGCASYPCSSFEIDIPATVTYNGTTYDVRRIGFQAFYQRNLTSVTIPDSVLRIEYGAFSYTALTSVAFEGNFPWRVSDQLYGGGAGSSRLPA